MASPILKQRKIDGVMRYYLDGRDFVYNHVPFTIVGSELTGPNPYDVIHTVKNIPACKYAELAMDRLISILQEDRCS